MRKKGIQFKDILLNNISNNVKEYMLVLIIFIIGIFFGVIIINNTNQNTLSEVTTYINNYVENLKNLKEIDNGKLLISEIKSNVTLAIVLWFAGTTIIGLPIVLGIILYRGIAFGYTISSCICAMGSLKGTMFTLISIFLQNILFIPSILIIGVSSIRLYKSIMKDKRKENIKLEILRHTILSLVMLVILIISAVVETQISFRILQGTVKYF